MKLQFSTFFVPVAFGLVLAAVPLKAQVTGSSLNIGPTSGSTHNTIYGGYAGVIGQSNTATGPSLVIGNNNVDNYGGSIVFGSGNTMNGYYAIESGISNSTTEEGSAIFGSNNGVGFSDDEHAGAENSLTAGMYNSNVNGTEALTAGYHNQVWDSTAAITLGYYLVGAFDYCATVGKYNAWQDVASTDGTVTPLFLVGNGTDNTHRANAFEVFNSGDIIIPKRQGDVLMGDFGIAGSGD